ARTGRRPAGSRGAGAERGPAPPSIVLATAGAAILPFAALAGGWSVVLSAAVLAVGIAAAGLVASVVRGARRPGARPPRARLAAPGRPGLGRDGRRPAALRPWLCRWLFAPALIAVPMGTPAPSASPDSCDDASYAAGPVGVGPNGHRDEPSGEEQLFGGVED